MSESGLDKPQWYVLRFLYRNQVKVRAKLEEDGIETFSPSVPVLELKNGKYVRTYKPVVRDLFFVHSLKNVIDPYVARYENLQYMYKKGGKYKEPLVVPDDQMDQFVKAVNLSAHPLYFKIDELDLEWGTRIRLIGGDMNGYEGVLLKVRGAREKRLIVEIPNTLVAAVEVNPDLVEIID